ncbi:hypothetical protein WN51_06323 [Melipona quadrifasciata]|uniref:Uncharacterized protein n=1 Tax=Melipona quadrifasciata TaxID=166423 RepID=A0A0M8ZQP4_9HYME|nr:hypothetical protein WN51_06323 [Melipona quadrifasciata]
MKTEVENKDEMHHVRSSDPQSFAKKLQTNDYLIVTLENCCCKGFEKQGRISRRRERWETVTEQEEGKTVTGWMVHTQVLVSNVRRYQLRVNHILYTYSQNGLRESFWNIVMYDSINTTNNTLKFEDYKRDKSRFSVFTGDWASNTDKLGQIKTTRFFTSISTRFGLLFQVSRVKCKCQIQNVYKYTFSGTSSSKNCSNHKMQKDPNFKELHKMILTLTTVIFISDLSQ